MLIVLIIISLHSTANNAIASACNSAKNNQYLIKLAPTLATMMIITKATITPTLVVVI